MIVIKSTFQDEESGMVICGLGFSRPQDALTGDGLFSNTSLEGSRERRKASGNFPAVADSWEMV